MCDGTCVLLLFLFRVPGVYTADKPHGHRACEHAPAPSHDAFAHHPVPTRRTVCGSLVGTGLAHPRRQRLHMYAHIFICLCMCMWASACVCGPLHVYVGLCMCMCLCLHVYVGPCMFMCLCLHVHVGLCMVYGWEHPVSCICTASGW